MMRKCHILKNKILTCRGREEGNRERIGVRGLIVLCITNWTGNMNDHSHLGWQIHKECTNALALQYRNSHADKDRHSDLSWECKVTLKHADKYSSKYIKHSLNKGLCYKVTHETHLDVASIGVVAVELAHVSIAGIFHFSRDENVSGEQSHFSTHVDSIYDLSNMVILRPPWAEQTGRCLVTLQ